LVLPKGEGRVWFDKQMVGELVDRAAERRATIKREDER
jgi:hypothetical protein